MPSQIPQEYFIRKENKENKQVPREWNHHERERERESHKGMLSFLVGVDNILPYGAAKSIVVATQGKGGRGKKGGRKRNDIMKKMEMGFKTKTLAIYFKRGHCSH